ncbi:MAG: isoprenyl transferase, partial [Clostridia bacterium]|nr:isoprenyl transferase [Clostridia bacterium]
MFKRRIKKSNDIDIENLVIPNHIAIIMDGNGRWAKKRNMPRNLGHKAGVEKVKSITKACSKLGVKYLTLYAFSTENWKRSEVEVNGLMDLLVFFLKNELKEMHENNVCISTIGDLSRLPEKPRMTMLDAVEKTKNNNGIYLTIALNYGSRDEITRGFTSIAEKIKSGELEVDDIDEALISQHLDTNFMPDPDLLIRTSGEIRLSNYLLWQLAYTEFYFCDTFWPDFDEKALIESIQAYT